MSQRIQRPTLLAVLAQPGNEAKAPAGTLLLSGWQGVRTILVTLHGGNELELRSAASRAAFLLGVETHFHWEGGSSENRLRLARLLRAFQPGVIVTNDAAQEDCQEAWALASDQKVMMPGLTLFEPTRSRLWCALSNTAGMACIDVSAARPLLRALRFYYYGTAIDAFLCSLPNLVGGTLFERFTLLNGVPLVGSQPTSDLFAGLSPRPQRKPIRFL